VRPAGAPQTRKQEPSDPLPRIHPDGRVRRATGGHNLPVLPAQVAASRRVPLAVCSAPRHRGMSRAAGPDCRARPCPTVEAGGSLPESQPVRIARPGNGDSCAGPEPRSRVSAPPSRPPAPARPDRPGRARSQRRAGARSRGPREGKALAACRRAELRPDSDRPSRLRGCPLRIPGPAVL
jgi:hypothetical protein